MGSYSYGDVHHSVVYNGEELETTEMFNNSQLVRQLRVYLFWIMKYYTNVNKMLLEENL